MTRCTDTQQAYRRCAAILMILAMLWLTVSIPFVYEAKQILAEQTSSGSASTDDGNPFANATEEKNEKGVSTISEYVHELQDRHGCGPTAPEFDRNRNTSLFIAFYGEMLSPPPEIQEIFPHT